MGLSGKLTLAGLALVLTWGDSGTLPSDDPARENPPPPSAESGTADQAPAQVAEIRPFEDILIDRKAQQVEIRAWVCLDRGFLEQVACSPGTREHESLMVVRAKPREIHAALLLAGMKPGRPGRWIYHPEQEKVELITPEGPELDVLVRHKDAQGNHAEIPVRNWIRDHETCKEFPNQPWIFGGSAFRPNPEFMGPGEHYVADMTGSIIGLVTFGDEVIGLQQIISDQATIHEPQWEVNADAIPAEGTEVTIILRPRTKPAEAQDTPVSDDGSALLRQ